MINFMNRPTSLTAECCFSSPVGSGADATTVELCISPRNWWVGAGAGLMPSAAHAACLGAPRGQPCVAGGALARGRLPGKHAMCKRRMQALAAGRRPAVPLPSINALLCPRLPSCSLFLQGAKLLGPAGVEPHRAAAAAAVRVRPHAQRRRAGRLAGWVAWVAGCRLPGWGAGWPSRRCPWPPTRPDAAHPPYPPRFHTHPPSQLQGPHGRLFAPLRSQPAGLGGAVPGPLPPLHPGQRQPALPCRTA